MFETGVARTRVQGTYLYLRLLVPVLALWLLVAIPIISIAQDRVLPSISDYYGGPLRDVFVGVLIASGVCMFAYKGQSKLEDYALNFAGVNTFLVAVVPNSFQTLLDGTREAEGKNRLSQFSSSELLLNLRIVVTTLLVMVVLVIFLDGMILKWTQFRWNEQRPLTNVMISISLLGQIVLAVIVVWMVIGHETLFNASVFSIIHFSAAALFVGNLSFAAASNAFPDSLQKEPSPTTDALNSNRSRNLFRTITLLMWATLIVGVPAIAMNYEYSIITVEIVEIVLFVLYWILSTVRERNTVESGVPTSVAVSN